MYLYIMNTYTSHTTPYSIDMKYLPIHWKTEYASSYVTLEQLTMRKNLNITNNSKQIKPLFSQYKLRKKINTI